MSSQIPSTQHRLPSQSLSQLLSHHCTQTPISTSIQNFDDTLEGGLFPGHIYEVCALSGSGKSSLSAQLVKNTLYAGQNVLWISTLQTLPMDTIKGFCHDKPEVLTKLHHIRLDSLGPLFIFIQSLGLKLTKYSLIVIDDFANCISRCFDDNEAMINGIRRNKNEAKLEAKRNKAIQNLLKLLSTYSALNNTVCTLFNSSTLLNMSFVEIKPKSISTQLPPSSNPHSSQSFMGSLEPRPKRLYQQVLVSPMGDHHIWANYLRARIMLYRDWTSENYFSRSTAVFVHFKSNRLQKQTSTVPKVVSFQETSSGIVEVTKEIIHVTSNSSNSFTLDEGDFGTDSEGEGEPEEDDLDTTCLNTVPVVLLESSPRHADIKTAKNILPDDLRIGNADPSSQILESTLREDHATVERVEAEAEEQEEEEEEPPLDIEANHEHEEAQEEEVAPEVMLETVIEDEVGANDEESMESHTSVQFVAKKNTIILPDTMQPVEEIPENRVENSNPLIQAEEEKDEEEEEAEEEEVKCIESTDNGGAPDIRVGSFIIPNDPLPMAEDTSVEIEEIEDELEELYPTQPESLDSTQLSQIPLPLSQKHKKRYNPSNLSYAVKRLRLPLQNTSKINYDYCNDSYDSQLENEEFVPASAPYF